MTLYGQESSVHFFSENVAQLLGLQEYFNTRELIKIARSGPLQLFLS